MPNITSTILVVNAVATLLVGAFVYLVRQKKTQSAVWLVYNILFCIWSFSLFKALDPATPLTTYWFRASLCALIFMAPVFLHFLSIYSDREVFKKQIIARIYILFFLIFALSFALPQEFIKNVAGGMHFRYIIVPGILFHAFALIFAGFIGCGFYYLLYSKKKYLSFKRNQRLWLFWGMFLGILAPFDFFLATYRITFSPVTLFFVIPYLGLVTYTILKYHVPEISIVINKMAVFAYGALAVILLHICVVYVLHRVAGIEYLVSSMLSGCIILLCLLFALHYGDMFKLNKLADRVVYEKRLDYYKFLEEFNAMLNTEKDLKALLFFIVGSLKNVIGIECASLYLMDEETSKFKMVVYKGKESVNLREVDDISPASPFINFLKEGNIFVAGESEDFAQDYNLDKVRKVFNKVNVRLSMPLHYSMPLYCSNDIVGFLNLGDKENHDDYSAEDVDVLNAFGREVSICLDKARLFTHAIEDDLTKLYRYNYFQARIEEELERSKRYRRPLSLLMMDVDDFKNINDTFGHQVGDEVLRRIAHIMKSCLRKVDIAARYGGEEFSAILPETDTEKALIAAKRIRRGIEEEFSKADKVKEILKAGISDRAQFKVTVSIGISGYGPGINKESLIKKADEALYKAKREGKNRICHSPREASAI